ncbi:uncharacterized protein LOC129103733 [Anoplopoma fimbria]|uniref:uncharacterized protein LOC129103733 n=1 Tax=Anoplopoma fimbria TaxID=229290 RepID=UPI0023EA9A58|nr:uncharacterized protein LOC129103733 [Anoplopoma fimbria]
MASIPSSGLWPQGFIMYPTVCSVIIVFTILFLCEPDRKKPTTSADGNFTSGNTTNHTHLRRFAVPDSQISGLGDNLWYQTVRSLVRKVTNTSCYACSLLPHSSNSAPLVPAPLNKIETLSVLVAMTGSGPYTVKNMIRYRDLINETTFDYENHHIRNNISMYSNVTKVMLSSPLINIPVPQSYTADVCFSRACANDSLNLGMTGSCEQTVKSTCSATRRENGLSPCRNKENTPYIARANLTSSPLKENTTLATNPTVLIPNSDGYSCLTSHVWVCGSGVYLILPPRWCGVCQMAIVASKR